MPFFSTAKSQYQSCLFNRLFLCFHHNRLPSLVSRSPVIFYFTFSLSSPLSSLSCLPPSHPLSPCLSLTPLFLSSPPVSESQLPTLNQQAAEDCGNPWNRRDQGCRQGATAALECGASEEIRAVSPARERGGMQGERSEQGGEDKAE